MDKATDEVGLFKRAQGGSICEMSVVGIRRSNHSAADLCSISKSTGVRIISATGFYCDRFLPDWAREMSVRDMVGLMMEEVQGSGREVKCGLMYIGCSYPLKETERRALEAAAITHKQTGTVKTWSQISLDISTCVLEWNRYPR